MDYFQVVQAFPDSGRWYLGSVFAKPGQEIDTSALLRGEAIDASPLLLPVVGGSPSCRADLPLTIALNRPGPALDLTLGAFDLPVARRSLGDRIQEIAGHDIQRIPAHVSGEDGEFDILNITRTMPCLDLDRSDIEWQSDDARDPAARTPFAIYDMVINPDLARDRHIFRLSSWVSAIIVSDQMREAIEQYSDLGVGFERVSK